MGIMRPSLLGILLGAMPGNAWAWAPDPSPTPETDAPPPVEDSAENADESPDQTADEPVERPPDPGTSNAGGVVAVRASPQEQLDDAVQRYHFGEADAARGRFAALVIDDTTPVAVRQEARVYLGELLYFAGDRDEARRFFEQVLAQDGDYEVDAFRHPPDVVDFFNFVRASRVAPPRPAPTAPVLPTAPTLVPPSPVSAMLGHGVYHFRYGRPKRGALYLGLQVGFLATEAALWGSLLNDRTYREGDEVERQRLARTRSMTGVVAAGYWGTWIASALDANMHWRQVEGPSRARTAATPATPRVEVHRTF